MDFRQSAIETSEAIDRPPDGDFIRRIQSSAAGGDASSLYQLAQMTWTGMGVFQDVSRGRSLFERAADLGHVEANLVVTNLLASGIAGKRDWPAAIARLKFEASRLADRRAALNLIEKMSVSSVGVPAAIPEAHRLSHPNAWLCHSFLTPAECAHIIAAVNGQFRPSQVYDDGHNLVRDTIRTSDGAGLHWLLEDPAIHAINRRIAALTCTDYAQGEALQVLRYRPGQEYRPHFDFVEGASNQRSWTVLIYLNDDYDGGETCFLTTDTRISGHVGDALLFRNQLEDGSIDRRSQHAGLPVTEGTKFLATRWIRAARWIP